MTVTKEDLDGIVTRLGDFIYAHRTLAELQYFLALAMAAHFGAGGVHPQILCWQLVANIPGVVDTQAIFGLIDGKTPGNCAA